MAQVWRDIKYSSLADRLVDKQTIYCDQKIFSSYWELMVFAAMVGFHHSQKISVNEKAYEIPQRVFENNEADAYVYLCALQDQKSGDIFREKNENECWKIFESYANSGLEIIGNWLLDSPGDTDGVDTILNKMKTITADLIDKDEVKIDLNKLEI
jgi:dnd system-associated protein 4